MGDTGQPPTVNDSGGVPQSGGQGGRSYSERLKANVNYNQRLKRNELEITLEKTEKDADLNVGDACLERVLKSIGVNVSQVEGYQTKYRGKYSIMSVWMEPGVNLDRFCKEETIKVTKGVSTGYIRPAGRPEVVVTITGLDFNTPDLFVIEYLGKFGTVVNKQPIYCKGTEGFMKNKWNGVRKYQVDFSKSTRQMGSYHFLDGEEVRIHYRGNKETCGRCHQGAKDCPGGGKKKECKEKGGPYVHISEHMRELWQAVNFVPTGFELPATEGEEGMRGDIGILDANNFERKTDKQVLEEKDIEKYDGIVINNFPLHLADSDILTFLFEKGLPEDTDKSGVQLVRSERNIKVSIYNLESIHYNLELYRHL